MTTKSVVMDSSVSVSDPKPVLVGNSEPTPVIGGDNPAALTSESREPSSSEPTDDIEACDSMRMYADELTQGIDPKKNVDDLMNEKSSDERVKDDPLTLLIDTTEMCKTSSTVEPKLSPRVTLITVNEKDIIDEKRLPNKVENELEEDETPSVSAGVGPLTVAKEKCNDSSVQVATMEVKPEIPNFEPQRAKESERAKEPVPEGTEAKEVEQPLPDAEKEAPTSFQDNVPAESQSKQEDESAEASQIKDEKVVDEVDDPQELTEPAKEELLASEPETPNETNAPKTDKENEVVDEAVSSNAPNVTNEHSTKKGTHNASHATFKPSKFLKKFAHKHHAEDPVRKQENESARVAELERESAKEVFEANDETPSTTEISAPQPENHDSESNERVSPTKPVTVKGAFSSSHKSFKRSKFMRKFTAKDTGGHEQKPKVEGTGDAKSEQTPEDESQRENDSDQVAEIEPETAKEESEVKDEVSVSGAISPKPGKPEDAAAEPKSNATIAKAAMVKEALSSTHKSFKKSKFLKKFSAKESEGRETTLLKKVFIKKPKEDTPKEIIEDDKKEGDVVQEAAPEVTQMNDEEANKPSEDDEPEVTMDAKSSESKGETPTHDEIAEEREQIAIEGKDTVPIITTVTAEIAASNSDQSESAEKNDSIKSSEMPPIIAESVTENYSHHEPAELRVEDNPESSTFLGFSISSFTENLFCKTEQYLGDFTSICAPRPVVETSGKETDASKSNEWSTVEFTSLCIPKPTSNTDEKASEAPVSMWNTDSFTALCAPKSTSNTDHGPSDATKSDPNTPGRTWSNFSSICGPRPTAETGCEPQSEIKDVDATVTHDSGNAATLAQPVVSNEIAEKNDASEKNIDERVSAESEKTSVEVASAAVEDEKTDIEGEAASNAEEPKELKCEESAAEETSKAEYPMPECPGTDESADEVAETYESNVELTTDDLRNLDEPTTDADAIDNNEEKKEESESESESNLSSIADNSMPQEMPIESTTAKSTTVEFSPTSNETPEAPSAEGETDEGKEVIIALEKGSAKMQKVGLFKRLGRGRAPSALKTDEPESVDTSLSPSKRGKFKLLASKKK